MKASDTQISTREDDFDPDLLRRALGFFPSGVTAFCGMVNNEPIGMAASSFTSVSLEPALVSLCAAHTSITWRSLSMLGCLGISVLSSKHTHVAKQMSTRADDRFEGIEWVAVESGAVFIQGSTLWLECVPFREVPAGDHMIVILRVVSVAMYPETTPMVFHRSKFHDIGPTT
jgi:flavin reductase (DIM6/NTAB) family NADH-FMN oxidoreductase RutF